MDRLLQDLRYALRGLVKDPGFTALTTLCLALGIGVNSTIFSLVDTVAIRPLPFPDPDQLVRLAGTYPANGIGRATVSPADFRDWKEQTRAFADIAGIALVLASIGVYGVLSYAVSQRQQEIGVRVALGATRPQVLRLILALAAKLTVGGIALGVVGAFGVTRVIKSLLYNVSPSDPFSFAATALFLALVALAASYLPARRATSVDPMIALRAE